jgi:hypothetical protein
MIFAYAHVTTCHDCNKRQAKACRFSREVFMEKAYCRLRFVCYRQTQLH